jgi:glycosyltransferase involved in cell wall biosynthesis
LVTRLSVIIIARNESGRIGRMLDSIHFADEVIVVDGGSTDETASIASERGAQVYAYSDWNGFGLQRNRSLAHATGDWVLALDCDEWISDELREELIRAIRAPSADAYRIPRASFICGRRVRHSGWWPDYVTRLFRRGTATFSDDIVHERLLHQGPLGTLKSPLMHETHRTIDEALAKMNRYSSEGALIVRERGRRGGVVVGLVRGIWMFVRTYVLRRGFLDGREGIVVSVLNAEATFWRYVKVGYLEATEPNSGE